MALAGSATDCLKRCFRQMGEQFGNSLYDKEIAQNAGLEQGRENGQTTTPAASTTSQASRTTAPAPIVRKYGDGVLVNGNVPDRKPMTSSKPKWAKRPRRKMNFVAGWQANLHSYGASTCTCFCCRLTHLTITLLRKENHNVPNNHPHRESRKDPECVLHLPVNRSPLCLLPQIAATTTRMAT
jgi:hypothetical protein